MSVNAAGDNKKKNVMVVVASIVILVALATIISMAIPRSHSKAAESPLAQNMAEAKSLADKCHGDYSQLSSEDQSKAFALFGPLASQRVKEAYKPH